MISIVNDFLIRENEEFEDYAKRLYKNKDIYYLTFKEIGDILNKESGQDFDESAYRKKYIPFVEGYEEGFNDGYEQGLELDEKDKSLYIEDLRKEREEHFKSKKRLQDKLREYRGNLTTMARAEELKSVLLESVEDLNTEYPTLESKTFKINQTGRVGVLQISDWHYGEIVEDNLNTYNMEIAKERIEMLTQQTIEYVNDMGIGELKILNLGDLIAGNIRISARVMNESDVITQITQVAELIVQMLTKIQQETCIKVEFYSVLDNHSRVSANYNQHIEAESFARLIPWYLEGRFEDNRYIEVKSNKINEIDEYDIGHFRIYDSDFLFVHGHNDKINSAISDISMLTKINPTSIFMGHLHSNIEKEEFEIDLIVNPSLVGLGAYSKSIRRSSKVRQKLNIYNKTEDGKAYREMLVFLELK